MTVDNGKTGVNFLVNISLLLGTGGKAGEEVVYMYETSIADDINQTAWNLSNCDNNIFAEKFGGMSLISYEIKNEDTDKLALSIKFTVTAREPEFVEEVITDYMDGFSDWIRVIQNAYYSRTGSRLGSDVELYEWNLTVASQ